MEDFSPLQRRTTGQQLTLDLLRSHVPIVKKGTESGEILKSNPNHENSRVLSQDIKAGSRSQEILLMAGLPLIKSITSREFQRRKAWSSRVSYDDILQEAISGFLRGLQSYNIEAATGSPTNYLGQWITTTIRRKIEALEHDLDIPYEVVERSRRIRAVTSKLASEFGREPTKEEILDQLNNGEVVANAYKFGKPQAGEAPKERAKKFTMEQVEEAELLKDRIYQLETTDYMNQDDDTPQEKDGVSLTATAESDTVMDNVLLELKTQFFNSAFVEMKIGSKQKDILQRYFGLLPYAEHQEDKEIAKALGIQVKQVKSITTAISTYMPIKGGVFHHLVLETSQSLLEDLEMLWLVRILGEWPDRLKTPVEPPEILTKKF